MCIRRRYNDVMPFSRELRDKESPSSASNVGVRWKFVDVDGNVHIKTCRNSEDFARTMGGRNSTNWLNDISRNGLSVYVQGNVCICCPRMLGDDLLVPIVGTFFCFLRRIDD